MGKLEETFDLPDIDEFNKNIKEKEEENNELDTIVSEYNKQLEGVEYNELSDLSKNDQEMDDIAQKTMAEFEDLMILGKDTSSRDSGKIFEAAASLAKISLEAKGRKTDSKLKMFELLLKKKRMELLQEKQESELGDQKSDDGFMDRNELIKLFRDGKLKEDE